MSNLISTDIFNTDHHLSDRMKLLLVRSKNYGASSINPELSVALDMLTKYNQKLCEARFAFHALLFVLRAVESPDYDSYFDKLSKL